MYGAYVWGCAYERLANADFQEIPPKQVPVALPVLHLTASILKSSTYEPPTQATTFTTEQKGPYVYNCPCFVSNFVRYALPNEPSKENFVSSHCGRDGSAKSNEDVLFTVTMTNSEITPSRWSTRNVACSLRPF